MLTFRCESCGKRIWPWQRYGMFHTYSSVRFVEEALVTTPSRVRYWHKRHIPADIRRLIG